MTLPIVNPKEATQNFQSLLELDDHLTEIGCHGCDLGFQDNINGCCVSRGSRSSSKMIIGEAPGKDEDSTRLPFTGPAGQLMDRIFRSVDLNTNDFYCTNVVLCRPVAPAEAKKQNLTPKHEQRRRCRPYLDRQIDFISPALVVTMGAVATAAILDQNSIRIGDYRGKLIRNKRYMHFSMLHPAAILHATKDPPKQLLYREKMWEDIQLLRKILEEENLL